jgi:hypothetical protein
MVHHINACGPDSRFIKSHRNRWGSVTLKVVLHILNSPHFPHARTFLSWTAVPHLNLHTRHEQAMREASTRRHVEHVPVSNANQMHSLSLKLCAAEVQFLVASSLNREERRHRKGVVAQSSPGHILIAKVRHWEVIIFASTFFGSLPPLK